MKYLMLFLTPVFAFFAFMAVGLVSVAIAVAAWRYIFTGTF